MYGLLTHDHVQDDISDLLASNPVAAYRILALLEELEESQDKLDRLTQQGYGGSPQRPTRGASFNVARWGMAHDDGLNLWRVRDFDLSKQGLEYRVIYAYFPNQMTYFVLAIVHRAFNYERTHHITKRIYQDYRELELEYS